MSILPTLTSQIQPPVDLRWLWALRVATLVFLALSVVAAVPELLEWDEGGPVVLWALIPALVGGLLLWGLRSNPPSRFCLACIVAIGSMLFSFLGFALLLATTEPMARSAREEGHAVSVLMPGALALGGAAYAALGIRVYYLMKRAPGDVRNLFRAFALIVLGGLVIQAIADRPMRQKQRALEQNAVVVLQLIDAAEIEYAKAYGQGFTPTLEALGAPPAGMAPSANAAAMSIPALEDGIRLGYRFTYVPGPLRAKGEISSYTLHARPVRYRRETRLSFYTDQTGIIRFTKEDRAGTVTDTQR
jgi:hypothetical protein